MRTNRTCAVAAFADAAFPRTSGGIFSATQKSSPNRTFTGANSGSLQTVNSLQPGPTIEERTSLPFALPIYTPANRTFLASLRRDPSDRLLA